MESKEDVVMSDQGAATNKKGTLNLFLMTDINTLMIIVVKDGEQRRCGCVRPRGRY